MYLIPKSLAVGKPQDVAQTTSYKAESRLRSVFLFQLNNSPLYTSLLGIVNVTDCHMELLKKKR